MSVEKNSLNINTPENSLNIIQFVRKKNIQYLNVYQKLFYSDVRFAPLTPEETANVAIDGVLRNQLQVCIPAFDRWLVFFICLLPYKVQHLFRDHILKEPEYWKTLVDAK